MQLAVCLKWDENQQVRGQWPVSQRGFETIVTKAPVYGINKGVRAQSRLIVRPVNVTKAHFLWNAR